MQSPEGVIYRRQPSHVPRPHTVHASPSSANYIAEENEDLSDSDLTPRASASSLSHSSLDRRRLSRDDTAADMHEIAQQDIAALSSKGQQRQHEQLVGSGSEEQVRDVTGQFHNDRGLRRLPSPHAMPFPSHNAGEHPSETRSLGRRWSRNYRQRIQESVQKSSATLKSRIRRSSQPFASLACDDTTYVDQVMGRVQTSPSKRTSTRQGEERPRKLRLGPSIFPGPSEGRKDTPAPPSALPVRPATNRPLPATFINAPGGDRARKAAAMHNIQPTVAAGQRFSREHDWPMSEDEDLPRRSRLGSLSSAADSGADLSAFGGSEASYCDQDGDVLMDGECSASGSSSHSSYDFVKQGIIPYELCLEIFEYLEAEDLQHAEQVNKAWYQIAGKTSVWRTVFLKRFGRKVYTDPAPIQVGGLGIGRSDRRPNQEWRKMYKARVQLDLNWRRGAENAGKAVYLSGHTDSVYCLQFDEEKIITGSRDRTIRVWDINTYQCTKVIGGPSVKPILGPKVLRTVDYPSFHMATASVNGTAYGDQIYHVPREWHDASILCLQYDDEILVTGSSDSDLLIWDIKTYEPIKRLKKHTGGVLDVALDANHIVSCSKDSRIIVWDRKTLEPKGDLTGHRGPVNAVQLRGNFLVSASGDGVARLWDLAHMKLIKEFTPKERGLAAVEFSEDMQYVLAGGNDNITYKFETATGAEVLQFTGHSQLVRSLWLDSANERVVSGSYDLDLRVYDFKSGRELWRGEEWTTSWMLAAKSDYRRIVATSQDGRILLVDFGILKAAMPSYNSRDGMPIENIDLLRGPDETTAIQWRNPWEPETKMPQF